MFVTSAEHTERQCCHNLANLYGPNLAYLGCTDGENCRVSIRSLEGQTCDLPKAYCYSLTCKQFEGAYHFHVIVLETQTIQNNGIAVKVFSPEVLQERAPLTEHSLEAPARVVVLPVYLHVLRHCLYFCCECSHCVQQVKQIIEDNNGACTSF